MGNIRIAQHRDTLRYATTHSGSYKPAARQLHPGSFVWTQRPQANTLQLDCTSRGTTVLEVQRRTQAVATQPAAPPLKEVFTTKPGRDRAAAAQRLHGRV
ncbi:integrase catalytic domain-containing protein, partial [Haematococcus lacustris]